jgi:hypothetical protein
MAFTYHLEVPGDSLFKLGQLDEELRTSKLLRGLRVSWCFEGAFGGGMAEVKKA